MCCITFLDRNIKIHVKKGTKLVDCIRKAGFNIETPCGGSGKCGKCKVRVFGELSPKTTEECNLTEEENIRLSCIAKVQGDVSIEITQKENDLKTINRGYCKNVEVKSGFEKLELFKDNSTGSNINYKVGNLNVLKKIGLLEKDKLKKVQGVLFEKTLIDVDGYIENILGVAVDIGTTGISSYLVDLKNGQVLKRVSGLNPQTKYGGDVISRITYSMENEDGSEILSRCIRKKIDCMIEELIRENYQRQDIYRISIAANTTMLHLFLGVKADSIAVFPYRSIFLNELNLRAEELGIHINGQGIVTILPSASSYIGADIISGIVAVDFHKRSHPSLFIDIGTNGEIVAICSGKMVACSTAAGPALEGMNIDCGMRAEEGAIDSFKIDENYELNYTTIGSKGTVGICGSALLDIGAAFLESSIITKTGGFSKELPDKISNRLVGKNFYITDKVFISQRDIRQIQLAKGAICSGMEMLLKEIDIDIKDIEEIVIAGAFGYHINEESIKKIGLIPRGFNGKINFVGNSSVEGARMAIVNKDKLQEMSKIRKSIKVIELSARDDFQEYFIKALNF
ncbi:ASKHA domain-containing protein [Clostridium sp. Mt-5]|uniref:ASKHA domain-containing protein n=1 Tax=Clostridium moutaii TaxID=3240932 RepID=A0ABV4BTB2_9CLOT